MKNTSSYNILKYSLIAFPLAFAGIPVYLHAPDYYSSIVGIRIEIIGFALLLLRLLDAFLDPLIGRVSDQYFKYRDKIIYFGSLLLVVGFWMIFHPLKSNIVSWFALSIFICTLGFSIIAINIQAFGGLWDIPRVQVTKAVVTREAIGLVGLLIASITPTILYLFYREDNFHILSIILILVMLVSLIVFKSWFDSSEIRSPDKSSLKKPIKNIFAKQQTMLFFITYFFSTFAAAIPATLIIFYVRDYLIAEQYLGMFLLVYFTSGALSMPLWKTAAVRTSCMKAWFYGMIFALFSFFWAFFLQPNNILGFFIICFFSGMAVGANLALPSAIIAEFINSNKDENYAASYYSISNFLSKFSLAIASGIALPILGFMGYVPGIAREDYLFPFTYAFLPCFFQIIAILLLRKLIFQKSLSE